MIDRQTLRKTVENAIAGTGIFIVDITVCPDNRIVVELDSRDGIDIDTCAAVTRAVEADFDRDAEDYELEVGSAGLTSPFRVREQYEKNIGNEVEVLTRDGRKLHGVLTGVTDSGFTVAIATKVREPGAKRPTIVDRPETFAFGAVKSVRYMIQFK